MPRSSKKDDGQEMVKEITKGVLIADPNMIGGKAVDHSEPQKEENPYNGHDYIPEFVNVFPTREIIKSPGNPTGSFKVYPLGVLRGSQHRYRSIGNGARFFERELDQHTHKHDPFYLLSEDQMIEKITKMRRIENRTLERIYHLYKSAKFQEANNPDISKRTTEDRQRVTDVFLKHVEWLTMKLREKELQTQRYETGADDYS